MTRIEIQKEIEEIVTQLVSTENILKILKLRQTLLTLLNKLKITWD